MNIYIYPRKEVDVSSWRGKIKERRLSLGFTYTTLSIETGLHMSTLSNIESSKINQGSIKSIVTVMKALKFTDKQIKLAVKEENERKKKNEL